MDAQQGAADAAPAQQQANPLFGTLQKAIIFYGISQIATRFLFPKPTKPVVPITTSPDGAPQNIPVANVPELGSAATATPIWPLGTTLKMDVYIASTPEPVQLFSRSNQDTLAHLTWDNIKWGDWKDERVWEGDLKLPQNVQNNETSIYAHIFMATNGASFDPYKSDYDPESVSYVRRTLTKYMPRKKIVKEKNLLAGGSEIEEVEEEPIDPKDDLWVPYWYQNLTLALVSDAGSVPRYTLPPPLAEHVHFAPPTNDALHVHRYYPIVYPNTFWHLSTHWKQYGPSNHTIPLRIDFHALSYLKFQVYSSLSVGFDNAAQQQGGAAGAELDEIKRAFIETNPILLIVTALVTVLHMVFEVLAFTSDVGHWRKKQDVIGVSVRTIITNVFVQTVILLYLLDNNENTSYVIFFSQGTGVLIEAWKVTKVLDIRLIASPPGSMLPYTLDIKDKHVLSEEEKRTQEYDRLAFRYVSYVAIPLLAGYTGYALMYNQYKGWYSFIISTLTSFVYAFGFAQLIPQLIINYKLKSVAHLPTKAFVYKFLGTIVDDFFAFVIKMPWLHRLACFRDDVVFVIFLYQRWIYRVDYNRVNEFGQVSEQAEESTQDTKGSIKDAKGSTQGAKGGKVPVKETKKNK